MSKNALSIKAIALKNNKILLLKPKHQDDAMLGWDAPGGHVKKGEEIEKTLSREITEETGLVLKKSKFYRKITWNNKNYLIYLCLVDGNKINLSDEHVSYKWVTIKQFEEFFRINLSKVIDSFVKQ